MQDIRLQSPEYTMLATITEDTLYVSVSRETSVVLEGIGPIDTPRLLLKFSQQVLYAFQVLLVSVESGEYDDQLRSSSNS